MTRSTANAPAFKKLDFLDTSYGWQTFIRSSPTERTLLCHSKRRLSNCGDPDAPRIGVSAAHSTASRSGDGRNDVGRDGESLIRKVDGFRNRLPRARPL